MEYQALLDFIEKMKFDHVGCFHLFKGTWYEQCALEDDISAE